jgi:hypothetical protein
MAQAVQHLLYKYKALSSNSSSTKKKKKAQAMKQRETNKKWQKSNFITNKLATDI